MEQCEPDVFLQTSTKATDYTTQLKRIFPIYAV